MKKFMSLMLTVIMVAGFVVFPMTANAAVTGLVEQDFSSLASSNDVKASLKTLEKMPWTINDSATSTYSSVDRDDNNGIALKWDVATSPYAWSVTNTMALPTSLVNEDPAGTQVWFSFDFEIPTANARYDIMLYPADLSNGCNGVWVYDFPQYGGSKPTFGATTGGGAGVTSTVDVTANGWHTIEVCQEKVNATDNTINLKIYLDGAEVMGTENLKPHNWLPYSVVYLHAGYNYSASSISYDNFKNFKCNKDEHTPKPPAGPDGLPGGAVVEKFSSIAGSTDIATALAASKLPWTVDTREANTFSAIDREDDNGTALKWSTTAYAANWVGTHIVKLARTLKNTDAAGSQSWFSFDFEIPDTSTAYDVLMFPDTLDNGFLGHYALSLSAGYTKAALGRLNTYGDTGTTSPKDIVGNGWHTIDVCQSKVNDTDNTVNITVYLDGEAVVTRENVKPHNDKPYSQVYIYAGKSTASSYIAFDNFKNFNCKPNEYTPVVPEIPEVPVEYEEIKVISTAAELQSAYGTSSVDGKLSDVPGTYGKEADDKAIRVAYAEGEATIGSYLSTVQLRKSVAVSATADDKRDIIYSFDMKNDDANLSRKIVIGDNGALKVLYEATYNNMYDIIPVNQWNHYDVLLTKSTADVYINGVFVKSASFSGTLTEISPIWIERQNVVAPAPAVASEIDNIVVAYSPVEESLERIQAPGKIFRNFDFTGVANNKGDYKLENGTANGTYFTPELRFSNTAADAICDGFAGKAASDKVMKFYSAANVWKQVMFTSDNSTDNTAAPKSYTSPVWGGRELEAGSTVRGGVSVLVDENSFTGTESTKRIVVQTSPKGNTGTILSQIDLQITQQDVRIQRKMLPTEEDIEIVAPKVLENQWNRVDYVLNVADGKGSKNTVDFYLNGVLMNDEPIVVDHNYPADNGTADTVSVGTVSLCVISNGTAPFYIDDITYEYIPADLEVSLEAFDKKVALPDSTDGTVVLGNGSITLMDAATSNVTAADLNGKLCPNTPVSLIDANGATVNSGLAAGNFAYLSRGIHPGIFYKVSDLKVNASGKKVTASMPFAAGSDTVIYVALYKSNGQLAAIAGDTAEDGLLSASVSNDEAASYEVFVWMSNANLKPYYAVANGLLG